MRLRFEGPYAQGGAEVMTNSPHRGGDGSVGPARLCTACGERIGVYELGVWIIDSIARETSIAADPEVADAVARAFHASCYEGPTVLFEPGP